MLADAQAMSSNTLPETLLMHVKRPTDACKEAYYSRNIKR